MTVQQYKDACKEAKRDVDTLKRIVYESYWHAQAALNGPDGLDDLASLENNGPARTAFAQTIQNALTSGARSYFHSQANLSPIRLEQMVWGYSGIMPGLLTSLVESVKGDMNEKVYEKFLEKNTEFQQALEHRTPNPVNYLAGCEKDALRYAGLMSGNTLLNTRININELSAVDSANLVNEFDANGTVRPVFLKKQHYFH